MTTKWWSKIKEGIDVPRPLYAFTAERDGDWWFVKSTDLPRVYTQVRRLDQAEEYARDVTALMLDIEPDSFDVQVVPVLADEVTRELVDLARYRREQLERLQVGAATVSAAAVRRLVNEGYSLRDIGVLMGISFQRAGQLAKAAATTPAPELLIESEYVPASAAMDALEGAIEAERVMIGDARQNRNENRNENRMTTPRTSSPRHERATR